MCTVWLMYLLLLPALVSTCKLINTQSLEDTGSLETWKSRTELHISAILMALDKLYKLRDSVHALNNIRFHADDSLIGMNILCTREEKICFQYNLLFDPETDKCQPFGEEIDKTSSITLPPLHLLQSGSGRMYGVRRWDSCPLFRYRMAYDGGCYSRAKIRRICGCDAEPTLHFLGGFECRCSPAKPFTVEQPSEEGHCRIPDLRFPHVQRKIVICLAPFCTNFELTCTSKQRDCFSEGKVWFPEGRRCFKLLQKGPCSEDHVVVLDEEEYKKGRAVARCSHLRGGCPVGELRMALDGKCQDKRFVQITSPGEVHFDLFGRNLIIPKDHSIEYDPIITKPNSCNMNGTIIEVRYNSPKTYVQFPMPKCGANNYGTCTLYRVSAVQDIPD